MLSAGPLAIALSWLGSGNPLAGAQAIDAPGCVLMDPL